MDDRSRSRGVAPRRLRPDRHAPETTDPLPFVPGEVSNGEFVPRSPTARDRWIEAETRRRVDLVASRAGLDRRRFLQGAGGLAVMLGVVNACGGDGSSAAPPSATASGVTTTTAGGRFEVPAEPEDTDACAEALETRGEFVFDVHTHHVMPGEPWRTTSPDIASMIANLVPAGCAAADPYECLDRTSYVHDLFLASDTTVALLSDVPNGGDDTAPLPFRAKLGTKSFAASLSEGGQPRVLVHDVVAPNFGPLQERLDLMAANVATGHVAAVKLYTAWGPDGRGYAMDDPAIGVPVVEHARELGVRIIAAHKGLPILGFDPAHNGPGDLVRMAARYPDLDFIVFHAAFERETFEGPYDPAAAERGVNSLVKAMDDAGLPPNSNVYAELGTLWRELMSAPDEAAHAVGKLLGRIGEDRVLWGTDGIWFGSPQPQIMAFRAFTITPAFQQQFGYPELTDQIKRKVLGLNAAALFGVDPEATFCAVDEGRLNSVRPEAAALVDEGMLPSPWLPKGPLTRRDVVRRLRTAAQPFSPL